MARNNVIRMNTLHLNSVRLNGIGEVQSVSLSAGADPEQPPVGNYIQFEDPAVEAICVANWSSDGIGLTMEDAAAVTSIGQTFKNNTDITSFDELQYFTKITFIGDGVSSNGYGAFAGCSNLKSITIPDSCVDIRIEAFLNCTSLERVTGLEHVTTIRNRAFNGCTSLVFDSLSLEALEGTLGMSAFYGTKVRKLLSTGSATTLGSTTTNSGTSGCFQTCSELGEVTLSDGLQYIGKHCFRETAISEITIPDSVIGISGNAFYSCDNLTTVDIGSGCESIGTSVFEFCKIIEKVICRASTPPSLAYYVFRNTNSTFLIYVPDASLEAYKTATNWSTYADRIHPLSEIEGVVIEYGYELSQRGNLVENDNCCVVGFVKCDVAISVRWGVTSGSYGRLCEYDSTGEWVDYWDSKGGISRTITISSNSSLLKATFPIDYVDNAYIYDDTNGKYLWKGKNVE